MNYPTSPTTSAVQRFASLPEPMQEQLMRLPRLAAGMSAEEKAHGRLMLATVGEALLDEVNEAQVDALEMLVVCGRLIVAADEAAGSAASWLVV